MEYHCASLRLALHPENRTLQPVQQRFLGCTMRYLLDTNIIIAAMKGAAPVVARMETLPASALILSSIVLAELEHGAEKSLRKVSNQAHLRRIAARLAPVSFDAAASRWYGIIRTDLEKRGQLIGPNDLLIAAQALSSAAVLVTDNTGEFSRVAGLSVENWLRVSP
ncbi:MAG: PIN domain-containing protein [Sulfuricellaceae bacterium]